MGASSLEVLYGTEDTRSPGHPHSLQTQTTPKQYAGKVAREPEESQDISYDFIGKHIDNTTKEHLWKEDNKYLLKTVKMLS